jgi:hypothetical protein
LDASNAHLNIEVSSVMSRPKTLEIRKKKYKQFERADKIKQSHGIEPDPSKDRVIHSEDNPVLTLPHIK